MFSADDQTLSSQPTLPLFYGMMQLSSQFPFNIGVSRILKEIPPHQFSTTCTYLCKNDTNEEILCLASLRKTLDFLLCLKDLVLNGLLRSLHHLQQAIRILGATRLEERSSRYHEM